MSPTAYLLLELGTLILFGLTARHAYRRGQGRLWELGAAVIYGILLEWGNILLFQTYHYSPAFWLALGPVPLTIGLCWGMILYGAMAYSDQLGLPVWAAPFGDATWAIVLDLAFDAFAIRLQLWTWTIPLSAGYFGVPTDNFFAWLWVAISFGAYTRWVRQSPWKIQRPLYCLAPAVAFGGLLLGIKLFGWLAALKYPAGIEPGGGMHLFLGLLFVCLLVVGLALWRGRGVQPGVDVVPTLVRWSMHGYFLGWAVLLAFFPAMRLPGMDMPVLLIWIALALLMVEALLIAGVARSPSEWARQIVSVPRTMAAKRACSHKGENSR